MMYWSYLVCNELTPWRPFCIFCAWSRLMRQTLLHHSYLKGMSGQVLCPLLKFYIPVVPRWTLFFVSAIYSRLQGVSEWVSGSKEPNYIRLFGGSFTPCRHLGPFHVEYIQSSYLFSEWMMSDEWVSEWMSEWVNEWVSEWVNGGFTPCRHLGPFHVEDIVFILIQWVSEWVNEWMSEWVSEWWFYTLSASRAISCRGHSLHTEWVSEWVSEWVVLRPVGI